MSEQYEQPLVSIDVVPVRFTPTKGLEVAIAGRINEPFKDALALPGVLLGNETIQEAAYRAVASKADIDAWTRVRHLLQIGAFDNSDRDPRGPTLSIAHAAIIEPGYDGRAAWAQWDAAEMEGSLPFDHEDIINAALEELRMRLWSDRILTRALLGDTFTTRDAVLLSEQLGAAVDKTNMTRTLRTYPGLIAEGAVASGKGRPATQWRFE